MDQHRAVFSLRVTGTFFACSFVVSFFPLAEGLLIISLGRLHFSAFQKIFEDSISKAVICKVCAAR